MVGVVGIDASLTCTGLCYIPPDWDGLQTSLRSRSIKVKRKEAFGDPLLLAEAEIERCLEITEGVIGFIEKSGVKHVCMEQHKMSAMAGEGGKPFLSTATIPLAELGMTIKTQVYLANSIVTLPMVAVSSRKWLIGKLKKKDQKEQVRAHMVSLGFYFDDGDQLDAFVVANHYYDILNGFRSRFSIQAEIML